jgi:hypothetical protein
MPTVFKMKTIEKTITYGNNIATTLYLEGNCWPGGAEIPADHDGFSGRFLPL